MHVRSLKERCLSHTSELAAGIGREGAGIDSEISTTVSRPNSCPLNLKEMNGVDLFVHIYTQSGLHAVTRSTMKNASNVDDSATGDNEQLDVFPQCPNKFSRSADVPTINPSKEEEERMCVRRHPSRREYTKAQSKNARPLLMSL